MYHVKVTKVGSLNLLIWGVRSSAKAGIQIILKNARRHKLGIPKIEEARAIIEHYLGLQ